jgi:hypothetical protein
MLRIVEPACGSTSNESLVSSVRSIVFCCGGRSFDLAIQWYLDSGRLGGDRTSEQATMYHHTERPDAIEIISPVRPLCPFISQVRYITTERRSNVLLVTETRDELSFV